MVAALEGRFGSAVAHTEQLTGGFSPGIAATVHFADGDKVFFKAVHAEMNPDSPGMYRSEAEWRRTCCPQPYPDAHVAPTNNRNCAATQAPLPAPKTGRRASSVTTSAAGLGPLLQSLRRYA